MNKQTNILTILDVDNIIYDISLNHIAFIKETKDGYELGINGIIINMNATEGVLAIRAWKGLDNVNQTTMG